MADKKPATPEEVFAEAVNLHKLGVNGDKEAVQKAHKMLKEICAADPQNCLAEAYLGSATALLGRDEIDPDKRFKLVLQGLKILDRAVSKEPEHIGIRILRGSVCYNLPDFYFHRLTTAAEDFSYLVSRYEADKKIFSQDFYWKILFDLGSAYKQLQRSKESESIWGKLWSVTTDPKYKELLRQEGFKVDTEFPSGQKSRQFRRRNHGL